MGSTKLFIYYPPFIVLILYAEKNEETSEIEETEIYGYHSTPLSMSAFKDFSNNFLQRWLPILLKLKPIEEDDDQEFWMKMIKKYLQKIKENGGDFKGFRDEACINAVLPLAIGKNMGGKFLGYLFKSKSIASAKFSSIQKDLKIICK